MNHIDKNIRVEPLISSKQRGIFLSDKKRIILGRTFKFKVLYTYSTDQILFFARQPNLSILILKPSGRLASGHL